MGWNLGDAFKGAKNFKNIGQQANGVGNLIKKGTEGVGSAWKKLSNRDITSRIEKCEDILKTMEPKDITVSGKEPTQTGTFIQTALVAMKSYRQEPNGIMDSQTMRGFNRIMTMKHQQGARQTVSIGSPKSLMNVGKDKFEDLKIARGPEEISGRHLQALVNELRAKDAIVGNEKVLQSFASSMDEIGKASGNKELQTLAKELSPQTVEPQSAIEVPRETMVAAAPTTLPGLEM